MKKTSVEGPVGETSLRMYAHGREVPAHECHLHASKFVHLFLIKRLSKL